MLKIIKIKFHETFGGWLAPRVIFHLFVVPHFNFVDTANRAVARFFVTGGGGRGGNIASAEGTSRVESSGDIFPQKIFKFGGSETLFSALVMRFLRKNDLD